MPRSTRTLFGSALVLCALRSARGAAQDADAQDADARDVAPQDVAANVEDTMGASTARAEDFSDRQARAHYAVGVAMYDGGRFAEAAAEFQAAYDLTHRAALLYNCYIAYRDSSQIVRARDSLRQYLSEVPDAPNRLHLSARLEATEHEVRELERVAAEQEAQRLAAQQATLEAQEAQRLAELHALQLQHNRPWWPWLLFGTGIAFAGAGVPMGVWNNDRATAIRDACTQPAILLRPSIVGCTEESQLRDRNDIVTMAGVADALWITGAALSVTGLVLAFLVPDDIVDVSGTSAMCTGDGCFAQLSLRTW